MGQTIAATILGILLVLLVIAVIIFIIVAVRAIVYYSSETIKGLHPEWATMPFAERFPKIAAMGAVAQPWVFSVLEAFTLGVLIAVACDTLGWLDLTWQTAIGFAIFCLVAKVIFHPDNAPIKPEH